MQHDMDMFPCRLASDNAAAALLYVLECDGLMVDLGRASHSILIH